MPIPDTARPSPQESTDLAEKNYSRSVEDIDQALREAVTHKKMARLKIGLLSQEVIKDTGEIDRLLAERAEVHRGR
jgi:hypothetical protein